MFIRENELVGARKGYSGSGNPTARFFATDDTVNGPGTCNGLTGDRKISVAGCLDDEVRFGEKPH